MVFFVLFSADQIKCRVMWRFIWVFTVCQIAGLEVSDLDVKKWLICPRRIRRSSARKPDTLRTAICCFSIHLLKDFKCNLYYFQKEITNTTVHDPSTAAAKADPGILSG